MNPRVTRRAARRVVTLDRDPTPEARAACARFGVELRVRRRTARHAAKTPPPLAAAARTLDHALKPGRIALLVGPSGSGKSTVLRALQRRATDRGQRVETLRPAPPDRAPIDAIPGSVERRLRALTAAGLADATLIARPSRELSDGQRWRLALARALDRAERRRHHTLLAIDEFAAALDPITARTVAELLARRVRNHERLRCAVASAREPVGLRPDCRLDFQLDARPTLTETPADPEP